MKIFNHPAELPNELPRYRTLIERTKADHKEDTLKDYIPVYDYSTKKYTEPIKAVLLFQGLSVDQDNEIKITKNDCNMFLNAYFERALSTELFSSSASSTMVEMEFDAVILSEHSLKKINDLIEEYDLKLYEDFIVYIIYYIQKIWIQEGVYKNDEAPERLADLKLSKKEIIKFKNFLSYISDHNNLHSIENSKIVFGFPNQAISFNSKTFKKVIYESILQGVSGKGENWQDGLAQNILPYNFQILFAQDFKYLTVQALHNFFKEQTNLKPPKGKQTTDHEIKCIIKIIEAALVTVRDRKGNLISFDEDKIKIIRHWINKDVIDIRPVIIS